MTPRPVSLTQADAFLERRAGGTKVRWSDRMLGVVANASRPWIADGLTRQRALRGHPRVTQHREDVVVRGKNPAPEPTIAMDGGLVAHPPIQRIRVLQHRRVEQFVPRAFAFVRLFRRRRRGCLVHA